MKNQLFGKRRKNWSENEQFKRMEISAGLLRDLDRLAKALNVSRVELSERVLRTSIAAAMVELEQSQAISRENYINKKYLGITLDKPVISGNFRLTEPE